MSSTSKSSTTCDNLDPSDMSLDDILNILAQVLGSPDRLGQNDASYSLDSDTHTRYPVSDYTHPLPFDILTGSLASVEIPT